MADMPTLAKAEKIIGNKIVFRNASREDAGFILGLRTDPVKGKYLSATPNDLALQVSWLEKYTRDNSQIYFIIQDLQDEPFGTVRLYDARQDSFCWGSWILKDGRPSGFAIESALIVYRYALELGFTRSHFDVRKGNESVWQFHERFGAVRVGETEDDYLYNIAESEIRASLEKYRKYLPHGIRIIRSGPDPIARS